MDFNSVYQGLTVGFSFSEFVGVQSLLMELRTNGIGLVDWISSRRISYQPRFL